MPAHIHALQQTAHPPDGGPYAFHSILCHRERAPDIRDDSRVFWVYLALHPPPLKIFAQEKSTGHLWSMLDNLNSYSLCFSPFISELVFLVPCPRNDFFFLKSPNHDIWRNALCLSIFSNRRIGKRPFLYELLIAFLL